MFRKTIKEQQIALFSSTSSLLKGKVKDYFEEANAWHNIFHNQVSLRIKESIFSPLFSKNKGAPNASIRIMISMMIIKEAHGWSDAQLFEQCKFNLLIRKALGLYNLDDLIPAESTYFASQKDG